MTTILAIANKILSFFSLSLVMDLVLLLDFFSNLFLEHLFTFTSVILILKTAHTTSNIIYWLDLPG